MKKLSILLALLLAFTILPASPALAAGITGYTLSGAGDTTEWTSPVDVTNPDFVSRLNNLVDNGSTESAVPSGAEQLAQFATSGSSAATYTVYRSEAGEIYLSGNSVITKVNAQSFYDLVSEIDGFYTYRPLPTATLAGGSKAAVKSSTYNFRKLDDVFYSTQYTAETEPAVSTRDGSLMLPTISPQPSSGTVTVTETGSVLFQGSLEEAAAYKNTSQSNLVVKAEANFNTDYYKGKVTYQYNLGYGDNIQMTVEGASTYPGELVILRASNVPAGTTVTASTDMGFTPKFYSDGSGGQIALMPVSYVTAAGSHYVEIKVGDQTQRFGVVAAGKTFQVQHLTVAESTTEATIASQQANDEFNTKFLPLRWDDDSTQHWSSRFMQPVSGSPRVTTQFGAIRYTNGSTEGSRHGGIDWACATGTPVYASNTGRVVYSGYLQLTGNTVLIEHGYGLKTWYYHMDTRNVQTGQMVTKGQQIGTVGTTGFSTGPHLHFSASVNDVFINPMTLINTDIVA